MLIGVGHFDGEKIYILALVAMVNAYKKGEEKSKYFDKLLGFYEFHYFDLIILKFIKSKMTYSNSTFIKEFKNELSQQLQFNEEINFDEWSNDNLMKMSSLLQ